MASSLSDSLSHAVRLEDGTDGIRVTALDYSLHIQTRATVFARSPYAVLYDRHGVPWSALNLLSSVHTTALADETWQVDGVEARASANDVAITVRSHSSAWDSHELRVRCTPRTVEISVRVAGEGSITSVQLLGGAATLQSGACGTFRSAIDFASVLVPTPTEPVQLVRPARSSAVLGVVGDADPGRLNAIFSPPPLVLGLGRSRAEGPMDVPAGDWLGLSLRAPVDALTFTSMRYEPIDSGFLLSLEYEGHTRVSGEWESPTVVLRTSSTGWGVIDDYRADLVAHGHAPAGGPSVAGWWREPIFCGWGAQCARMMHRHPAAAMPATATTAAPDSLVSVVADASVDDTTGNAVDSAVDSAAEPEEEEEYLVAKSAPNLARQDVYDEFLETMAAHDLHPGTIVIDDRWQAEYGTATPDLDHWPDLRAWIDQRHANRQKVLLWWKAWDASGLPADECVLDARGRPVSVDPANPRYLARLTRIVHELISPDGLNADGFKVDFTQRAPSGQSLRPHEGVWGIAALHRMLDTMHLAAKEAKPDALVICHTVHPSFGNVCDMVRLNDVLKRDIAGKQAPVVDQVAFRHQIATRALPHHVIDTDQWPMPNKSEWLDYTLAQPALGVPALYYLESIDRSGERIEATDLEIVAASWAGYREALTR